MTCRTHTIEIDHFPLISYPILASWTLKSTVALRFSLQSFYWSLLGEAIIIQSNRSLKPGCGDCKSLQVWIKANDSKWIADHFGRLFWLKSFQLTFDWATSYWYHLNGVCNALPQKPHPLSHQWYHHQRVFLKPSLRQSFLHKPMEEIKAHDRQLFPCLNLQ